MDGVTFTGIAVAFGPMLVAMVLACVALRLAQVRAADGVLGVSDGRRAVRYGVVGLVCGVTASFALSVFVMLAIPLMAIIALLMTYRLRHLARERDIAMGAVLAGGLVIGASGVLGMMALALEAWWFTGLGAVALLGACVTLVAAAAPLSSRVSR